MAMVAIARRRKLLDDRILIALLDDLWVNLDISGSDVTDIGLSKAVQACPNLYAVDIRYCYSSIISSDLVPYLQRIIADSKG